MRVEKVTTQKKKELGWNPKMEHLPDIVKDNLDHWLNPYEKYRRRRVLEKALIDMVRDRQAKPFTTILYLCKNKRVEEKEFTFFKTVREK